MSNTWINEIVKQSLSEERARCFLTPNDIEKITDQIRKTRNGICVILDKKQVAETLIKIRRIEILSLITRIEELAIDKIWEDERIMWYYENILCFGDMLQGKYWDTCQLCLYRQILSWDPNPRKEIIIADFGWEDSILKHLIKQQKHLLSLEKI